MFVWLVVSTLQASEYLFTPINSAFDNIAQHLNDLDRTNRRFDANPTDLKRLYQLAGNDPQLKARVIFWNVRMGQLDLPTQQCINQLKEAERLCQPDYDYDLSLIYYQLAGNYERLGNYLGCYNYCRKALPVMEKAGDNFFLGNTYLLLVQLFLDLDDDEQALQQLQLAEANYRKAHFQLNRIYFFRALLTDSDHQKLKWFKKSIESGGNDWALTIQGW